MKITAELNELEGSLAALGLITKMCSPRKKRERGVASRILLSGVSETFGNPAQSEPTDIASTRGSCLVPGQHSDRCAFSMRVCQYNFFFFFFFPFQNS